MSRTDVSFVKKRKKKNIDPKSQTLDLEFCGNLGVKFSPWGRQGLEVFLPALCTWSHLPSQVLQLTDHWINLSKAADSPSETSRSGKAYLPGRLPVGPSTGYDHGPQSIMF